MTIGLCWLAAAVWLCARPLHRPGRVVLHRRRRRSSVAASPDGQRILTAAAAALACLALLGLRTGAVVAVVLAPSAVVLVRHLQARHRPGLAPAETARLPLVLDLVAVALTSGQPLDAALFAAAAGAQPWLCTQLRRVAGLLRLGAEPADAWLALADDPRLRPIAATAVRSAGSGIRLAAAFTELATELRAEASSAAEARGQRAGVWAIAPLGLCFLPAFVCLGIAPTIIGVASGLLGELTP
jgi:Flp pilus assembly protein TadB